MNLVTASRLATVVLTGAVLILYVRHSLFAETPLLIGLQVAAGLLMLWARLAFGRRSFQIAASPTAGGLVTRGPYAWLRHPIYAALLLFFATAVAAHPSALSAGLALLSAAAIGVRVVAEERLVAELYPGYVEYAARTKRFIPFLF